jgi:hypothetical protein
LSLSIDVSLGNVVIVYIYRELCEILKEGTGIGAHLFAGALLGYSVGEGVPLLGIRKDNESRAQGTGISFRRGPVGKLGRVLVCRGHM